MDRCAECLRARAAQCPIGARRDFKPPHRDDAPRPHWCPLFGMAITTSPNVGPSRTFGPTIAASKRMEKTNYSWTHINSVPKAPRASPNLMSQTTGPRSLRRSSGGQDETDLRILDVRGHRDLSDRFPRALYRGFAFKKDRSGFYYVVGSRDAGQRVRYHVLGADIAKDVEIFGQGFGADTWIEPRVSEDGRYLLINGAARLGAG